MMIVTIMHVTIHGIQTSTGMILPKFQLVILGAFMELHFVFFKEYLLLNPSHRFIF